MNDRKLVLHEARSWLGTPYIPCGDIKHAGVDCGMLLVRVFVDAAGCAPFEPRPYAKDWHLHRNEEKYLAFVTERCKEINREQIEIADIMIFKIARCYAHAGIISNLDPLTIIHAYSVLDEVVETVISQCPNLTDPKRRPRYFSYWDKA